MIPRRTFLKASALATAGLAVVPQPMFWARQEPIFKISLAQWSLNRMFFSGRLDNLDFAKATREMGMDAVEYVNQFFKDKATDGAYLREMKARADGEGVRSVLIMCDHEGRLGNPDASKRREAVENHYKWVEAAKYLGCHTIRVNGYSEGSYDEQLRLVADGLRQLAEYGDRYDINVIIENHGGYSSNGQWLAAVIEQADHPRAGTLPDFGNFRIDDTSDYNAYQGVEELMPYAKGVSVKVRSRDGQGNQIDVDMMRMMKIVLDAGWRGYCGIEHTGPEGHEFESVIAVRKELERVRESLRDAYAD